MKTIVIILVLIPGLLAVLDFDYPFSIERPRLVEIGEEFTIGCNVGSKWEYNSTVCTFTNPENEVLKLNLETGQVTLSDTVVEGYEASGDEKTCNLKIASVKENDIGEWTCSLPKVTPHKYDHSGKFHILTPAKDHVDKVRLPRHLIPNNYDVSWVIHLENETHPVANGRVGIDLSFTSGSAAEKRQVTLHTKQLLIDEDSIELTKKADKEPSINVTKIEYDLEREFLTMYLDQDLANGSYRVEMDFVVALQDDMRGLYRSSYEENGKIKYLAATQFEKTDARKAFPCLDEPNMKATFNVEIDHHKDLTAVSNTKVTESSNSTSNFIKSKFDCTPKMSTYLLAILVSSFDSTKSPSEPDFLQVFHAPSKSGQAELAAQAGTDILRFYETYFDIPYEISKMDMAAIPDFDAGAMENWGLITYREGRLLYQEGLSAKEDEDAVVEVIAHEISHQWFGNLVTMDWWTDLWLNEGRLYKLAVNRAK